MRMIIALYINCYNFYSVCVVLVLCHHEIWSMQSWSGTMMSSPANGHRHSARALHAAIGRQSLRSYACLIFLVVHHGEQ